MRFAPTLPIPKGLLVALILTALPLAHADDPSPAFDTPSAPASGPIVETRATFESGGKTIAVERFEPQEPGKYPVAVVLHGSGGMAVGGFMFRNLARELAGRGYLVVLPHYFDRTGTTIADMTTMVEKFPVWIKTVADASSYALDLPNAQPDRVALVGFSLGSYLSLSASTFDPRVKVVVDYFGGLPDLLRLRADRLPPTLILHGDADRIVPISEARKLESLLEAHHIPFEKKIYEGAGHGFFGASDHDATHRAVRFLDQHMKAALVQASTARTP